MTVILWILASAFVASVVVAWRVRRGMDEPDRERMLLFAALPTLTLLLAAIFVFLAVRLTRYKIGRIDALLPANAPPPQVR